VSTVSISVAETPPISAKLVVRKIGVTGAAPPAGAAGFTERTRWRAGSRT
jgi:hypothetical protein